MINIELTTEEIGFLKKMPILKYLKEPVDTLLQLYEKYPMGGSFGEMSLCTDINNFARWDVASESWKEMGNEASRIIAENVRIQAEAIRNQTEGNRNNAEEERTIAEELRQTNTNAAITNTNNATLSAITATNNAITAKNEANTARDTANTAAATVNASVLSAGRMGSIAYNAPAPTPARNCYYEFLSAGACSWLSNQAVQIGDRVDVVYNGSAYVYSHIGVNVSGVLVDKSTTQTITAQKDFTVSPTVPAPTADLHPANRKFLEDKLLGKIDIKKGTNKSNPDNYADKFYLSSIGQLLSNLSLCVTDYIEFDQTDINIISNIYSSIGSGSYNALYNSNKVLISTFQGNIATWSANVAYVRFSGSNTISVENRMINTGSTLLPTLKFTELFNKITEESIVDNSVTESKIKDDSVSPKKTNFFEIGKNLFDKNDANIAFGFYVLSTNGNLMPNVSYNVSGHIPVTEGDTFTFSYKNQLAWYNVNKGYISGSASSDSNKTQLAPVGACYVRCTISIAAFSLFQVEKGTKGTEYEAYGLKISPEYISLPKFTPTISLTRKLHILANNENSVYFKSLIERWNTNEYAIHGTGNNWTYGERYMRAANSATGTLTLNLFDATTLDVKVTKSVLVVESNTLTNNGAKTIQVIGDSFTFNGYFFDKINQLCPSLTFVGLRKSYNTLLKAEGRGGWTLADYMSLLHSTTNSFSPFLHPIEPYKYYGNTAFWIQVKANSGEYGISGFTDIANAIGFNASTGLKVAPSINDEMYNESNSRFEVYNGSVWGVISEAALSFTINYAKYLLTWGITIPDCVSILLGTNDFRTVNSTDITFATWKNNMDILITSIKAAATSLGKNIKIAICLPMTETASANNSASINPIFQRANMFNARARIIAAFDNDAYSNNSVDVVDTGTAVDGDYGFDMLEIKPFSDYTGTHRELYSSNAPHPSNGGYSQLGIRLAAYIQSIR